MKTSSIMSKPLRAEDIMSTTLICAHVEDDLIDVVTLMVHASVRHVVILDGDEQPVGILSDRDVRSLVGEPVAALARVADGEARSYVSVDTVMTNNPIAVRVATPVADIARHLIEERIGALLVVGLDDDLLGVVSYVDVLHSVWHGTLVGRALGPRTWTARAGDA